MSDEFPTRRTPRPNRQSRGALIDLGLVASYELQIVAALTAAGFPPETHADAVYAINEAANCRIERRIPALRLADEREDLEELLVRTEDVLDSLRAIANPTRLRILDALPDAAIDTFELQKPLGALVWCVKTALKSLPADVGGVKHNDSGRQFLADLAQIFFQQFPNSDGVKRNGSARDYGTGEEYSGALLDFVVSVLTATGTDVGSKRAIGEKLHSTPRPYPNPDGPRRLSIQDWARKGAIERAAREVQTSIDKKADSEKSPDGG